VWFCLEPNVGSLWIQINILPLSKVKSKELYWRFHTCQCSISKFTCKLVSCCQTKSIFQLCFTFQLNKSRKKNLINKSATYMIWLFSSSFQKQPYAFGSPEPPQLLSTLSSSSTLILAKYFKYAAIFFIFDEIDFWTSCCCTSFRGKLLHEPRAWA